MFSLVRLTEGNPATDIDLTDTRRYALVSYIPSIAALRDSALGGTGPYQDVADTITLHTVGATASGALSAAAALNSMLDQAWRWWRGQAAQQVRLRVQTEGGRILEAIVRGRVEGQANMSLPIRRAQNGSGFVSENITVQFIRAGTWLIPTSDTGDTATASAVMHGTPMPLTLATDHAYLSPIRVDITGTPSTGSAVAHVAVAPPGGIVTFDVTSPTPTSTGTGFTTVAEANTYNGNVLRYTSNGSTSTFFGLPCTLPPLARTFMALIPLRKNQATSAFGLRVTMISDSSGFIVAGQSETVMVQDANTNPQVVVIGPIVCRSQTVRFNVDILPQYPTTVAGNTLDIGRVTLVQVGSPDAQLFRVTGQFLPSGTITINPFTTDPVPRLDARDDPLSRVGGLVYAGTPGMMSMRGNQVSVAMYATSGTAWRWGTTPTNNGASITRRRAYVIPE